VFIYKVNEESKPPKRPNMSKEEDDEGVGRKKW
jgi:hypothetical protein